MTIYITSDTHFYHQNICGPDGFVKTRQRFATAEAMDETLIKNHNAVVHPDDTVYHLGDIALNGKDADVLDLLDRLNGRFVFIKGNHDSRSLMNKLAQTYEVHDVGLIIKANKKSYYLTHFPMNVGSRKTTYRNLCGHIHEKKAHGSNMLNVGVDSLEIPDRPFGEPLLLSEAMDLVEAKYQEEPAADYPFKGHDWTEVTDYFGIEAEKVHYQFNVIQDDDSIKVKEWDGEDLDSIHKVIYVGDQRLTVETNDEEEILLSKLSAYLDKELKERPNDSLRPETRAALNAFLDVLIDESEALDYNTPVFRGIRAIEEDSTFVMWFIDALPSFWT